MRILVRFAPPFRRWHLALGTRLEQDGHILRYEPAGRRHGRWLLGLERRLYGIVPEFDAPTGLSPAMAGCRTDLTIDLGGRSGADAATLFFEANGRVGESALVAAMRGGEAPTIRVFAASGGAKRELCAGRPAIEDFRVAARAMETVLPRLVTLLVQAVRRYGGDDPGAGIFIDDHGGPRGEPPSLRFVAAGLWSKLARRFGAARGRPEHWRIGLRRVGEDASTMLPDNPDRFRADPFLVADGDRLWLFAEDYPYARGKGVITCQRVDPRDDAHSESAPAGDEVPRVVLEEPGHLSYPLVLRHAGSLYMLPENAAASRLVLYHADPFPTRWVASTRILTGRFADATPVFHGERWWLFATAFDDGGSSWDQLHLFHAPDLQGPWVPHDANPVLIDAACARPAGHMWHENGALIRPVQDCRRGYGGGVALYRVDRLDTRGFCQTRVGQVRLPAVAGVVGLHTINRANGWEAFDVKVPHPQAASRV